MLELIISLLISIGIHFTPTKDGRIGITAEDMSKLKSSQVYQSNPVPLDEVVIIVGVDPSNGSSSNQ